VDGLLDWGATGTRCRLATVRCRAHGLFLRPGLVHIQPAAIGAMYTLDLLTNYHRYVDQFVAVHGPGYAAERFTLQGMICGNVVIERDESAEADAGCWSDAVVLAPLTRMPRLSPASRMIRRRRDLW